MAVSVNGKQKSLIRLPPRHCNQTEALYSVRSARFRFREFPTSRLDISAPHGECTSRDLHETHAKVILEAVPCLRDTPYTKAQRNYRNGFNC